MNFEIVFMVTMVVFGVLYTPPSTSVQAAPVPNPYVNLMIHIEIPPTEDRLEPGGWLPLLIEQFAKRPVPEALSKQFGLMRICGFAAFPTLDGAEYYYYTWYFKPYNRSYAGRVGAMTSKIKAIISNKGDAMAKVTKDGPLYFDRHRRDYRCSWSIKRGNVELPIFVQKYSNDAYNSTEWREMVKKQVISRFEKANETIGMVIVSSHFSTVSGTRRVVIYDLDRPHQPVFTQEYDGQVSRNDTASIVSQIHEIVGNWTTSCPVELYKDRCYFVPPGRNCSLRYMAAAAPNQSMKTFKYCARNASLYVRDAECKRRKCQETCDLFTGWTECNSTCGGYRWLKRVSNPAASPYMPSIHLRICPGLGKDVKGKYKKKLKIEQCANDCTWIKGLIAFGIVVLVLVVAGLAVTVFCLVKTNRDGDAESRVRMPKMEKSAKQSSTAPIAGKA